MPYLKSLNINYAFYHHLVEAIEFRGLIYTTFNILHNYQFIFLVTYKTNIAYQLHNYFEHTYAHIILARLCPFLQQHDINYTDHNHL